VALSDTRADFGILSFALLLETTTVLNMAVSTFTQGTPAGPSSWKQHETSPLSQHAERLANRSASPFQGVRDSRSFFIVDTGVTRAFLTAVSFDNIGLVSRAERAPTPCVSQFCLNPSDVCPNCAWRPRTLFGHGSDSASSQLQLFRSSSLSGD
jgi:hypothetical protein